jgi:hypothetical protein
MRAGIGSSKMTCIAYHAIENIIYGSREDYSECQNTINVSGAHAHQDIQQAAVMPIVCVAIPSFLFFFIFLPRRLDHKHHWYQASLMKRVLFYLS